MWYYPSAELGDYDPRQHESGYISEFRLLPNQTTSFEKKVEELHKELVYVNFIVILSKFWI